MLLARQISIFATVATLSLSAAAGLCATAAVDKAVDKHTNHHGMAPCMTWVESEVEPRAALLCVHGLGLHNASYESFGKRMASQGIATYAVDVRGFGSWQNAAGRTEVDFDECLEDIRDTLKVMRRAHPGLPVYLLGESMGGAIALRATAMYPDMVDGLISCVPSADRFRQGNTDLKVALRLLRGSTKKFDVGTGVIAQATESKEGRADGADNGLREAWASDPLARLNFSAKELLQFQRFMNENHASARKITDRPVLMVQGWDDNLVKASGTLEIWKELATDDKQIELVPKAKHLIFEESQFNDQALNLKMDKMVIRWMDDHIKNPANAAMPTRPTLN